MDTISFILKGKRMKKLQINIILSVLLSSLLLKADTVEDLTAEPVENLSPSVITMPVVENEEKVSRALNAKRSNVEGQDSGEASLETVNGKIQRKVDKSSTSNVTKEDEEAPEAENLEPAGVDNL